MNKKTLSISILLILLITVSISTVSAENNQTVLKETSDTTFIQDAVDRASDGDTINLGENKAYNLSADSVNINKKVTIKGENVTITASASRGALSIRSASDVTVEGITFVNPVDLPGYGGKLDGKAIYVQASDNIKINNCKFINYAYGVEMYTTRNAEVTNSYFNGATTSVSGMAGTGTKAIQLMGSEHINIANNIFEGQIYDALSIASTSGYVTIENNTFINNTFAIFYGGASTEGNKIKNNRFITCGIINETYSYSYTVGGKTYAGNATIGIEDLPVIGLQKASSYIEIIGNEFTVKDNTRIIYSEAENTAHGFPSVIGDINITDNTVKKADSSVDDSSVTFYHLKIVTSLSIDPTGDIILKNNNFTDVPNINKLNLEFASITVNDTSGDITIPKSQLSTMLAIVYAKNGRVVVELTTVSGKTLVGEKITYRINSGNTQSAVTDEYGHIYINDLTGNVDLDVTYSGSSLYYRTTLSSDLQLSPTQTLTSISATGLTVNAINAKTTIYKFTLKDNAGNALKDQSVSISFNGKIYTATSDGNGIVSFALPTAAAGKYAVTMAFTGDSTYKGSVATSTINIVKQATKLTVAKKTFKKSATKKVTAVLKDNAGKVLSGKKVTMKVNGKTYTAKTNSKGVATFKVKLTKKGTFKATTKFAGDSYYTAKTTSSKIVVK
ncbi:MAG: right-handed parallel beta-helix repeat-containing protein [Methanobrevibacter sp.]|nr:right-handed parallel beta-helix repeat-containing protein [Methanobrevibacter sp.]MBQ2654803.1 right-handed parallel beta-helix repeat-containing protein [Methanobrevibacter sp.]